MNNNLNDRQQFKTNHKIKAIVSLISGVISIAPIVIAALLGLYMYLTKMPIMTLMAIGPSVIFTFFLVPFLIAIIGLICGILGLKSTKRNFAIAGIVLCAIGLMIPLYYFLFY